jgi:nicotinate phosphoribosyltransferase
MNDSKSALLTDLYQLTMLQGYLENGMDETAVFELFVRNLPPRRSFLMAAGLEQLLQFLEELHFEPEELEYLSKSGFFTGAFLERLKGFRFTGDVHALPEGTLFFAGEPAIRVTAPLPQAQLVESRLINLLHFETLIASKAARLVLAAPGKLLVDFGMRRAHGSEAAVLAARASYLAGFSGTATVLAAPLFGIPLHGTMGHSFIQAHDREASAFENFTLSQPENAVLLIDTYDTELAAEKVVALAEKLKKRGIKIKAVRLDSGDLLEHARRVRKILDRGGLGDARIFLSGGLDENELKDLIASGAPVDGFGIGSRLGTSADAPYLDCAYKLQEYAGRPRRKRSEGKATWPGRKQIYRTYDQSGRMVKDVVTLEGKTEPGEPLLKLVMKEGKRAGPPEPLSASRQRAALELSRLPEHLERLEDRPPYPVEIAPAVKELAQEVDGGASG